MTITNWQQKRVRTSLIREMRILRELRMESRRTKRRRKKFRGRRLLVPTRVAVNWALAEPRRDGTAALFSSSSYSITTATHDTVTASIPVRLAYLATMSRWSVAGPLVWCQHVPLSIGPNSSLHFESQDTLGCMAGQSWGNRGVLTPDAVRRYDKNIFPSTPNLGLFFSFLFSCSL